MRYVITGGAGFIGSQLALELQKSHEALVIDNFSSGDFRNLHGFTGDIHSADLRTLTWENLGQIDAIFHQGAVTDTRKTDQMEMMGANVEAFRRLLAFACPRSIPVIYASSAAVYGNGPSPMREDQELRPLNIYGFSKKMMEEVAKEFSPKYPGMQICGLRYFNVFGPGERFKEGFASMIWQIYQQLTAGRRPRLIRPGTQTRDHVYVKDIIRGNLLALHAGVSGVFNLATGTETDFNTLVREWNALLGTQLEPDYFENPYPFFQHRTCANMEACRKALGFEAEFSVRDGMADYFRALRQSSLR